MVRREARVCAPLGGEAAERVVDVKGVHKAFGDHEVLRGVDLALYPHETVVVLGRSGTGKSVLLKLLVGLIAPDRGRVCVLGKDVNALRGRDLDELRLRLGFAFQHAALYDGMSVGENLAFPLLMNRRHMPLAEVEERVERVAAAVGLPQTLDQMPAELSGGQRKRIGIARTLILEPQIMLYDEPTAGLDPKTSAEMNELILEVRDEFGTASIVITHDLTCARTVHDRIVLLADGKVLREGPFGEVFPSDDPRVQAFYEYNFLTGEHGREPAE